jgi:hypothetical protein
MGCQMAREGLKTRVIPRLARRSAGIVLLMAAMLGAACDEAEPPTNPGSLAPPLQIETFTGTLAVGGSAFYSFNVPVTGPVSFTLLQYRGVESGTDTDKVANVGIGIPAGTTCIVASAVTTKSGNSPQFEQTVTPSIYCVRITDPGQLEGAASFIINIAHPK